jgi:hypothetical protein
MSTSRAELELRKINALIAKPEESIIYLKKALEELLEAIKQIETDLRRD